MNFIRIYQVARLTFKPIHYTFTLQPSRHSFLKTEFQFTIKRLSSWWTNARQHRPTRQMFPYIKTNRDHGNHDVYLLSNGDSKAISRLRRTRQTLRDTKVIMERRMEDMKENIFTIPNGLSITRMAATPFLGYLVLQEMYIPAVSLFVLAGITDVLDGYIARNFKNQQSKFGSFLDPVADKFLVATLFLTLTYTGLIPVPLTMLIISRDICLVGAGIYIRYSSLPAPRTFLKFFDVTLATASVSPTTISKLNTAVQLGLVTFSLAAPVFNYVDHPYLQALWYFTAGTTILSGASYLFTKNTYKILTSSKTKVK